MLMPAYKLLLDSLSWYLDEDGARQGVLDGRVHRLLVSLVEEIKVWEGNCPRGDREKVVSKGVGGRRENTETGLWVCVRV